MKQLKMPTKRQYTKRSPIWGKSVTTPTTQAPTTASNDSSKFDRYVNTTEQITGHKFSPSEILKLGNLWK
jgi:hypothetical protein